MISDLQVGIDEGMPTKQKILICALNQFITKGYSETTIRDIAADVGITSGTIYSHFSSKDEMLVYMLDDYSAYTKRMFDDQDVMSFMNKDHTGKGISDCVMASIAILMNNKYYAGLLHLIHQEQHRNPLFGEFLIKRYRETREYFIRIIDALIEMNVLRSDINADYWGIIVFSLMHTMSTTYAINIRLQSTDYAPSELSKIFQSLFDAMLSEYKV